MSINPHDLARDENTINILLAKIRRDLRKSPKRADFKLLKGLKKYSLGAITHKENPSTNRRDYLAVYNSLLKDKVIDEESKEGFIEYYEVLAQYRTFLELILITDKGESFELVVIGVLPEHAKLMASWWVGQTIDSQQLQTLIRQFESEMSRYNIRGTIQRGHLSKSGKVVGVESYLSLS